MPSIRPSLQVAVVMRRERIVGPMARWQDWRWVLADVVPDEAGFGRAPRLLVGNEAEQRWLHPGFTVELFKDDAEGYYLNLSTEAPCWFVMWRIDEQAAAGETALALPQIVTLSYHDAGRWLDAQETVEQVPAAPAVLAWLREFCEAHYLVEPNRRQRPQSFRGLQDRFGQPASVSTGPRGGAGDG